MTREEKIAVLKDIIEGEIIHPQVRKSVGEWAVKTLKQEPNLERLKDKLHDKIEIYVCEVEENTLIAQGMLNALGMMDEVLENAEKGGE